jgi:hypothetical protein
VSSVTDSQPVSSWEPEAVTWPCLCGGSFRYTGQHYPAPDSAEIWECTGCSRRDGRDARTVRDGRR